MNNQALNFCIIGEFKGLRNFFDYTNKSSSRLYAVVSETQLMFEEITKLQIPDIIPFENIQMEKKYKELTLKLLD